MGAGVTRAEETVASRGREARTGVNGATAGSRVSCARLSMGRSRRFTPLLLLGHTKLESTVRYLGIEVDDALAIAEQVDI